jgi:hypothetical protein
LHRSHNAGFDRIYVGGKYSCETILIDPKKAILVGRTYCGGARWGWSLFA